MSDSGRFRRDREPVMREPTSTELIDAAVRKVVTAVVIAGSVIALAVYSRPGPPRYQAFAAGDRIVRVDMRSGTVLACENRECMTIVRRGQRLKRDLPSMRIEARTTTPALPAPGNEAAPVQR